MTEDIGVIHGRFQILHRDHLKYLMAGKALCRHLVVGITNPDPFLTLPEESDPKRSDILANPLTYYERYVMIKRVLTGAGLEPGDFSLVPLPVNMPERYCYYVPMDALFLLSICDEWGRRKLARFRELGLRTHVLWEVPPEQKGISAAEVRARMIKGIPWHDMVPRESALLMEKWRIPERLRRLAAMPDNADK
ncbi:MAG: nicotinate-nucleotide adenylyltransferase [Desulfococcaceae bacterium]